jgi:hypothetical protein|tara:strand:- start:2323 stop:2646 length:324 start_codon:yes stop_codon:yes gene_type:complete
MNLSSRKNLDIKISEITQLFNLINELNNTKKKKILLYKLESELDFTIDKLEDYYYRYVLKNKSEKNIEKEAEKTIYNSKKTMEAFLPYILMYSMTENYTNNETSQIP